MASSQHNIHYTIHLRLPLGQLLVGQGGWRGLSIAPLGLGVQSNRVSQNQPVQPQGRLRVRHVGHQPLQFEGVR